MKLNFSNLLLRSQSYAVRFVHWARSHVGLVGAVCVAFLMLISLWISSSLYRQMRNEQALLDGKRLEISLVTGEIKGAAAAIAPKMDAHSLDAPEATEPFDVSDSSTSSEATASSLPSSEPTSSEIPSAESLPSSSPDQTEIDSASAPVSDVSTPAASEVASTADSSVPATNGETMVSASTEATPTPASPDVAATPTDAATAESTPSPTVEESSAAEEAPQTPVMALDAPKPVSGTGDPEEQTLYTSFRMEGKPVIVIVMRGLGLSIATTQQAMQLPKEVSFGFSPYAPALKETVEKAREAGHEILIHLPMETSDMQQNDPGPFALFTNAGQEQNIMRTRMLLGVVAPVQAVYSDPDERFSTTVGSILPVLEFLKEQNIPMLYGTGHGNHVLLKATLDMSWPFLVNDVVLDDTIGTDAIAEQLLKLESFAKRRGYAVALARPYPVTCNLLARWLPTLEAKGLKVVPASYLSNALVKEANKVAPKLKQ